MEGKLRLLANPLSEKRLDAILQERETLVEEEAPDVVTYDENNFLEEDEVSILFYKKPCSCSKKSSCKTNQCECFALNNKCGVFCHNGQKPSCKNLL